MSLERYAQSRPEFRRRVIDHKKRRTVHLGPHLTLLFEDELTIRYQIQEMLRIERIFEEPGIEAELMAYNPLVPDGENWKTTLLIEYEEPELRARQLVRLKGIERCFWVDITAQPRVQAVADEDLDRDGRDKTAAVHFLRFQFSRQHTVAMRAGASIVIGVEHPDLTQAVSLDGPTRAALLADLN
jgi:hypothetical protein